jgi:RNA polymerase sigma factor FliA
VEQRIREERILRDNWFLVIHQADKMKERLPYSVNVEDIQSSMALGLLDAIRRFDPAKGVKLQTYAVHRMRGMALDELRELDWVPRLTRSRQNRLEDAHRALERRLGRIPTDPEIAGELGISIEAFDGLRRDTRGASPVPLKRRPLDKDADPLGVEVMPDARAIAPVDLAVRSQIWDRLRQILPPRQMEVVELYYRHELTLKVIGQRLGLSESRACQLLARAHAKARVGLETRERRA